MELSVKPHGPHGGPQRTMAVRGSVHGVPRRRSLLSVKQQPPPPPFHFFCFLLLGFQGAWCSGVCRRRTPSTPAACARRRRTSSQGFSRASRRTAPCKCWTSTRCPGGLWLGGLCASRVGVDRCGSEGRAPSHVLCRGKLVFHGRYMLVCGLHIGGMSLDSAPACYIHFCCVQSRASAITFRATP